MNYTKERPQNVVNLPNNTEPSDNMDRKKMIARHKASLKQYREEGGGITADQMRQELIAYSREIGKK